MLDLYEFVSKFRYLFQNMEKLMEIRIPKNSFSVVPAFAHCTSRSTHRTVNAQSTRREYRKQKTEESTPTRKLETTNNITARGTSSILATHLVGAW